MHHRMLLALDGSDASKREVEYVAEMTVGRDMYFHLVHVLPPLSLTEPEGMGEAARGVLEQLRERLGEGGVPLERIDVGTLRGGTGDSVVDALLDVARDQKCDTIVIGRDSLPWHRELLHHHPADELVKRGKGFAVWVVE